MIPIRPLFEPKDQRARYHFGRIAPPQTKTKPPEKVFLLGLESEIESEEYINLINALSLIPHGGVEKIPISSTFPLFIEEIKDLRLMIEKKFPNYNVYFNLTPFSYHLHAILYRNGMESDVYNFKPYEIIDPHWKTFNYVFIPNFLGLESIDWEIMSELAQNEENTMSLRQLQTILEMPGWNRDIKTIDQKLRLKLNDLVQKGFLDVVLGANGEKFYYLRKIGL